MQKNGSYIVCEANNHAYPSLTECFDYFQAYAHPELCDQFFLCTNGTLTVETCENGLLFDGKGAVHNHCNYNWAVDCGERKADRKSIRGFMLSNFKGPLLCIV